MAAGNFDGSIRFDTRVDTSGFQGGIKGISAQMSGLTSIVKRFAGVAAAAFSIRALVGFGKEAIGIASDLTEVQNVVDTAFGSMSGMVDEWAKSTIKNFGMSELAAKRTASTYMAMSKGMGQYGAEAAQMAIQAAERTADIASFYNMTQDEADTMIKSIWTGETESLKRIGVVMTQTNLDAYALANGFGKTTAAMTQAEQVQLRYQYVMDQTRLAAGDFVRTQDSWANQTRILSEQWKQLMGIIGDGLMKILLPAVKGLNNLLASVISFARSAVSAIAALFGKKIKKNSAAVASATDTATDAQLGLGSAVEDAGDKAVTAGKKAKKALAPFDELNILSSPTASGGSSGGGSGGSGGGGGSVPEISDGAVELEDDANGLGAAWKAALDYIRANFAPVFEEAIARILPQIDQFKLIMSGVWTDIMSLAEPFKQWLVTDFTVFLQTNIETIGLIVAGMFEIFNTVFSSIWDIVLFPFLQNFVTVLLPMITQVATQIDLTFRELFLAIKDVFLTLWSDVFEPVMSQIMQIWLDVTTILRDLWDQYGETTFAKVRETIRTVKDVFLNTWNNVLKPVWEHIMEVVDWLWTKHLKPLVARIGEFIAVLVNGAMDIYNKFIAPIVKWFNEYIGPVISNNLKTIADIFGTVFGFIADILSALLRQLGGVIDFIAGVFTLDWQRAWKGLGDIVGGIVDGFKSIFKGAINLIIDLINNFTGGLNWIPKQLSKVPGFGWAKDFQIPRIPKLAQGAVIPPNQQFAAILGDQKHGRNLEAPEGLIRDIVSQEAGADALYEAIVRAQNNASRPTGNVIMKLDGKTIGKVAIKEIVDSYRRTGVLPIPI